MSMSKKDFIAIADAIKRHNRRAEFTPPVEMVRLHCRGMRAERRGGKEGREVE